MWVNSSTHKSSVNHHKNDVLTWDTPTYGGAFATEFIIILLKTYSYGKGWTQIGYPDF